MAIMPGANWLGEHGAGSGTISRYDIVCVHTIVGYAPAHAAHFSTHANGQIDQSRDTRYRSAANYMGNYRVIAIENEDHGPAFGSWNTNDGHQVPGFTAAQMESIAQILAWAYRVHGVPLVLAPDSKPGSRGIAYHRQGISSPNDFAGYAYPGRVPGGEVWTTAPGKVCPGDRRISQLIQIIIPRARVIAGLDHPVSDETEEEEMAVGILPGSGSGSVKTVIGRPWKDKDVAMHVSTGWGGSCTGRMFAWAPGHDLRSDEAHNPRNPDGSWKFDFAGDYPVFLKIPAGVVELAIEYACSEDISVTWEVL